MPVTMLWEKYLRDLQKMIYSGSRKCKEGLSLDSKKTEGHDNVKAMNPTQVDN